MNFNIQYGNTPLQARNNLPLVSLILIFLLIILILVCIWFLYTKYSKFIHSEAYLEKEKTRQTKKKDIKYLAKEHNLSQNQENLLWEICSITEAPNVIYTLKNNDALNQLFHKAYDKLIENNISDEKLNDFFTLLYKLEMVVAQIKGVTSSKFIPVQTVVFYITSEGEQFPMYLHQNTKENFSLEMPEFLFKPERRPKILVRQRFTFKTKNGLSYNFVSRIIRYEETQSQEKKFLMYVAHSDELKATVQRHFKREFLKVECFFSPVKINPNTNKKKDAFIFSSKVYKGIISNISAGGCCIQTPLPVKENQSLCILLPKLNIEEKIIGVIKRTRKLPNTNLFALHIQFIKVSNKSKNRICSLVYKFEL